MFPLMLLLEKFIPMVSVPFLDAPDLFKKMNNIRAAYYGIGVLLILFLFIWRRDRNKDSKSAEVDEDITNNGNSWEEQQDVTNNRATI